MSVIVNHLSKVYGEQKAVDNISFEAKKGEILGFLGPNGAGKSTTMKILTCFIPQTEGKATVCNFDTETQSMEVRKHIGYLPEHNPLYRDMYVREYLMFIAGLHKIDKRKAVVDDMIERTGLGLEQHKLIQALSRGYRQRVGLAQALLHQPEVLILDEPTSGLDPNQLVEIRRLIKDLGEEKTVIFSSHIMQEIEALCDRVIIINRGKLVANDSIDALRQKIAGDRIVTVQFDKAPSLEQLRKIKNLKTLQNIGTEHRFKISSEISIDLRPQLFAFAVQQQLTLLEMYQETSSVEDIFQKLTKNQEHSN